MARARATRTAATVRSRSGMARRRDERRGLRRWLPAVVAVLLLAGAAGGAWWLRTSPVFRVVRVETGPYRFTRPARLDSLLETRLGANLWAVDTGAFAAELAALPWVRDAACSRRVPGTLEVRLHEWSPRLVREGETPRAFVEDGRLLPLPAHVPHPAVPGLVVDAGVEPDPAAIGALLDAVRASALERIAPLDYVLCRADGLSLALADGTRLILGADGFPARLERFLGVADEVPPGAAVDLRYERQVFFEETSAAGG